ncbi:MAG: response regulator [Chitinophagales bacterium]|nr:response regulator [Chitinophagales bacterium]
MNKKLNCILLVDDNEADNFFHELVIKELDCTRKVVSKVVGMSGIEYLKDISSVDYVRPELIFLDINMPAMNAWEFMDAFKDIPGELTKGIEVVILTTSLNPDDEQKAQSYPEISGFKIKPLTNEMLCEIVERKVAASIHG